MPPDSKKTNYLQFFLFTTIVTSTFLFVMGRETMDVWKCILLFLFCPPGGAAAAPATGWSTWAAVRQGEQTALTGTHDAWAATTRGRRGCWLVGLAVSDTGLRNWPACNRKWSMSFTVLVIASHTFMCSDTGCGMSYVSRKYTGLQQNAGEVFGVRLGDLTQVYKWWH